MAREINRDYIATPELLKDGVQLPTVPINLANGDWLGLNRLLESVRKAIITPSGTITGRTFRTAVGPDKRVEIDTKNGIRIYDANGDLTAQLNGGALTLLGGTISGGTITGSTFKTDASPNARLEMDSAHGLRIYDSLNALVGQFNFAAASDPSITSGASYFFSDNIRSKLSVVSTTGQVATRLYKSDGGADQKFAELLWESGGGVLALRFVNDAYTIGANIMRVTQSGGTYAVSDINFPAPVSITGGLTVSGTGTIAGKELSIVNTSLPSNIYLDADAGQTKKITARSAGIIIWQARFVNSDAQSGGNAGANYDLAAYDDTGSLIDIPFKIFRAAGGVIELKRPLTSTSTVAFATAQTVVNGSVGGDITVTEMFTGASYKAVVIRVRNYSTTGVYTFQNPFVAAPLHTESAGITVTPTTTQVTVATAGLTNGWVKLEGF